MIGKFFKHSREHLFRGRSSKIWGSESTDNVGDLKLKEWAQDFVSYLGYLENTENTWPHRPSVLIRATKTPSFPIFLQKEHFWQEDNPTRILEGIRRMVSVDDALSLELKNMPEEFNSDGLRKVFKAILRQLLHEKYTEIAKREIATEQHTIGSRLKEVIGR